MSVSSVDNAQTTSLLSQYYYQNIQNNANRQDVAQNSAAYSNLDGVTAINADGDTFQLSGNVPPPPPPTYSSDAGSSTTGSSSAAASAAEMFSAMDTDGDGAVSEEEFSAARPSDVTEEMAANLYDSLDTDGSGTLSESEYETAMSNVPSAASDSDSTNAADSSLAAMMPPPPPPFPADSSTADNTSARGVTAAVKA